MREKSYFEVVAAMAVGVAAVVYIWQWWSSDPPQAPIATVPGAASSPYPQAVTGRPLKVYVAR